MPHDNASLKAKIIRPINTGDYDGAGASLTLPEQAVDHYLMKYGDECNVADVVGKFGKAPYGWDKIATLYFVTELVRRHRRDYSYANNPTVSTQTVASHLIEETNKFTLRQGVAIPQDVMNAFIDAWKGVFGPSAAFHSSDSTQIFNTARSKEQTFGLESIIRRYRDQLEKEFKPYNFSNPVSDAVALFEKWMAVTDVEKFFKTVISQAEEGKKVIDEVKKMRSFFDKQLPIFKRIVDFANINRDNFRFLPEELRPLTDDLLNISRAKWPFVIKDYKQKMDEVDLALDALRNEIREEIKRNYLETFKQLEQYADSLKVSRELLADRDATIENATRSNNILVLRDHRDTDDFYREQAAKLLMAVPKPDKPDKPDKPGDPDKPDKPDEVHEPKHAFVKLQTRSLSPISSEADIDNYLEIIKTQLMRHLDGDTIITVE